MTLRAKLNVATLILAAASLCLNAYSCHMRGKIEERLEHMRTHQVTQ